MHFGNFLRSLSSTAVSTFIESFLRHVLNLSISSCFLSYHNYYLFIIKVGFRHAYQAHQARAALYLKNKSQSAGWASLEVALPPAPYLKSAQEPLEGVNPVLANGATATLNLALEAMLPFDGCPECVITFTNGNGAKHR